MTTGFDRAQAAYDAQEPDEYPVAYENYVADEDNAGRIPLEYDEWCDT